MLGHSWSPHPISPDGTCLQKCCAKKKAVKLPVPRRFVEESKRKEKEEKMKAKMAAAAKKKAEKMKAENEQK